jgi:hypothetical protein
VAVLEAVVEVQVVAEMVGLVKVYRLVIPLQIKVIAFLYLSAEQEVMEE